MCSSGCGWQTLGVSLFRTSRLRGFRKEGVTEIVQKQWTAGERQAEPELLVGGPPRVMGEPGPEVLGGGAGSPETRRPPHPLRVSQLDQICISFDEGKTTMNFVEAALLIQGSACVYSKKVGLPCLLGALLGVRVPSGTRAAVLLGRVAARPVSDLPCEHLLSPSWIPHRPLPPKNKLGFKVAGPASNIRQGGRAAGCREGSGRELVVPRKPCCRERGTAEGRTRPGRQRLGGARRKGRQTGALRKCPVGKVRAVEKVRGRQRPEAWSPVSRTHRQRCSGICWVCG